ncbi:MAG TPA: hypothetical protein VIP82_15670 [Microbacterium sp.]|uniref:hypothetical protein n=1 Tax=Microbacterium sp. TaxID=51671 RepID=UPI002F930705
MDQLADTCDGLVDACVEVASSSQASNSQFASEASLFRKEYPQAEKNVEYAPAHAATAYADVLRHQLASISALLQAREVVGTLWPIVRAQLETAGRVVWLLDPELEQPAGKARVARYYLEAISSFQRAGFTHSKYDRAAEKAYKAERSAKIAAATSLFPDFELELGSPDLIADWKLGGEPMLGLGAGANLFAKRLLSGPGKALYDILSDYSHPSLVSIESQTRLVDDGKVASHPWVVPVDFVEHQCRWACTILYKTYQLASEYLGVDPAALERWADGAPADWFDPVT